MQSASRARSRRARRGCALEVHDACFLGARLLPTASHAAAEAKRREGMPRFACDRRAQGTADERQVGSRKRPWRLSGADACRVTPRRNIHTLTLLLACLCASRCRRRARPRLTLRLLVTHRSPRAQQATPPRTGASVLGHTLACCKMVRLGADADAHNACAPQRARERSPACSPTV